MSTAITPKIFAGGFRMLDTTVLNSILANPQYSTEDGITATAGGTQAAGYVLLATLNRITTVASAADSLRLPPSKPGLMVVVVNDAASNALQIYGHTTSTINDVATATGISIPAKTTAVFYCTLAGKWYATVAGTAEFNSLILNGATSGTTAVNASAIAGTTTLTLPAVTGTVASTTGTNLFIADVKKCTAQTDTITTVLANVTGLTAQTLVAGATYRFRCVLPGTADGTSGIKYAFKYTTATLTSIEATGLGYTASAVAVQHTTTTTDATLLFDQAAAVIMTILEGSMVVNAGGTVALQVGTHTGTTTASTYLGATMEFVRIA